MIAYTARPFSYRDRTVASSKKASKKRPKDSQLVIRINRVERDRFIDSCAEIDTTAAREIRRFIKEFLEEKRAEEE